MRTIFISDAQSGEYTDTARARVAKPGNGGGLKIRSRRGPRVQIPSLALSDPSNNEGREVHAEGLNERTPLAFA